MTAEQEAAWEAIEAAANQEGRVTYYSVGSVPADRVDLFKKAFAKDYPDIQIDYLAIGNNAAIVSKVTTEQDANTVVGDVVDMSKGNALRLDPNFFMEFDPPAAHDPGAEMAFDPMATSSEGKPIHTGMMAQYFGFWVNTDLVKVEDAPKTYMDFTDPKWKGNIAWQQMWRTGGGNHTYTFATQEYGDAWVKGMQAQDLTFFDNQDNALLAVAKGEFAVSGSLTGRQAPQLLEQGLPLAVIWPQDFAIRVTNGIIIQNGAPHPNAAKVFANWMIGPAGQKLWQELGQFPTNLDYPPPQPWQQGFNDAPKNLENLTAGAELQTNIEKAESEFLR